MDGRISEELRARLVRSSLMHWFVLALAVIVIVLKIAGIDVQITYLLLTFIIISILTIDFLYIRKIFRFTSVLSNLEDEHQRQRNEICRAEDEIKTLNSKIIELERYAIVAQQTENAIMLMDAEGNVLWINDCFTKMYGYTYEEFIAKRGSNIRQTSFNPKIQERLNRCINGKQPVMYEALNNCTNGEDIWTHTTLSPILNEKGEVTHLVTVDSNIHKKKEARDELVNSIIHFTEHIDKLTGNLETLARVSNRFFETSDRTNSSLEETDAVLAIIRDLTMSLRLLGFNASIEANHLAEKAKGFRVIANEIVGISKNTEDATSKIRETFDSIKEVSAKLIKDKDRTEDVFGDHRKIIDVLKKELDIIERAAVKLK